MFAFFGSSRRDFLFERVVFCMLAILFFGAFWWPGGGSSWAAVIRVFVFCAVILSFFTALKGDRQGLLTMLCMVLFGYLLWRALLGVEDYKPLRRVVLVACFVYVVSGVRLINRAWFYLIAFVALLGAVFSMLSLSNLYYLGRLIFSYRSSGVFESGVPGLADFGNTIVAGMHYAFCFVAAMWLFFTSRSPLKLWLWLACTVVIGLYLLMTYSRASWLASVAASLVLFVMLFDRARWFRFVFVAAAALVIFIVFYINYFSYEFNVRGLTGRDEVWSAIISRVSGHWIFGRGAGAGIDTISIASGAAFVSNAHSLYLEILYKFGVVGLVLALFVVFLGGYKLFRLRRDLVVGNFSIFCLAIMVGGGLVMLVELNDFVSSPNLVWQWLWLPLAVAIAAENHERT